MIKASDLLTHSTASLPKQRQGTDLVEFVREANKKYLQLVEDLDTSEHLGSDINSNKIKIQDLCDTIAQCIAEYRSGLLHKAFQSLDHAMTSIKNELTHLASGDVDHTNKKMRMFRFRIGAMQHYQRNEMFHIPFEKRHLVATQRYSIPGLPALYLGGSTWCCWEEMNRPNFSDIHVCEFRMKPDARLRILDFGYRPTHIALIAKGINQQSDQQLKNFVSAYAICWPLIAACSLIAEDKKNGPCHFVHEYIIPQLLLQWIRANQDWDGIRYFSTRIGQSTERPGASTNFVFPAQSTGNLSGHCDVLKAKFQMTPPLPWVTIISTNLRSDMSGVGSWTMNVTDGVSVAYNQTEFGRCEAKLSVLSAGSI